MGNNDSKEFVASIFVVSYTSNTEPPHPTKPCYVSTKLHGVTFHTTTIFMATLVTTPHLTLNDSYGTLGCDLYGTLVGKYHSFEGNFCRHLQCNYHHDWGSMFLINVSIYLPN